MSILSRLRRSKPIRNEHNSVSGSPLVVTFCSRDYIPVLANFIAALRKLEPRSLRVYCLDDETHNFCMSADVEAQMLMWDGSLKTLWEKRVEVFGDLISAGQDFVHSDADAVWLRDPVDLWTSNDADMTFSQGTIHPQDVHDAIGFVLCCGFFRMNASAATKRFLGWLAADVAKTGDDQASVNRLLFEAGTKWRDADVPDYRLRVRGRSFKCWKRPLEGFCPELDLKVSLIPHSLVQRIEDPLDTMDRAYVKHPLTAKNRGDKLDEFGRQGLLAVRQDWRDLPTDATFGDYLA